MRKLVPLIIVSVLLVGCQSPEGQQGLTDARAANLGLIAQLEAEPPSESTDKALVIARKVEEGFAASTNPDTGNIDPIVGGISTIGTLLGPPWSLIIPAAGSLLALAGKKKAV